MLHSKDEGIILDPYVGAGLCMDRNMIQALQSQYELMNSFLNTMAEMGDPTSIVEPEEPKGYQPKKPQVNEWWKKN